MIIGSHQSQRLSLIDIEPITSLGTEQNQMS